MKNKLKYIPQLSDGKNTKVCQHILLTRFRGNRSSSIPTARGSAKQSSPEEGNLAISLQGKILKYLSKSWQKQYDIYASQHFL